MAPLFTIIRYALLETFFCIPILPKTSSLYYAPPGLFSSCPLATRFETCFYNCTNLWLISSDMFDNCAAAIDFNRCFVNCAFFGVPDVFVN